MIQCYHTEGVVTNYGEGGYKTGGGASEVLPLLRGSENVFAMLKGGTNSFELFLTW